MPPSLLLAALVALIAHSGPVAADPVLRLDTAEAVLHPEGLEPQVREVGLRHRWDGDFPGRGGRADYRIELPRSASPAPRALLIERVGNQAVATIDDEPPHPLGPASNPRVDSGKTAHLIDLPPGAKKLRIAVTMQAQRSGGLSPVLVGAREDLAARFATRRLLDQILPAGYAAGLLLMGALAAGLWWRQRDPIYGCFSLAALAGSLRHLDRVWLEIPLPWLAWGALLAVAYACHLGLIARFIVLVGGRSPRWLVRAIHAVIGTAAALGALSFAWREPGLWTGGLVLLLLLGLGCFAVVLRGALEQHRASVWFVLGGGVLLLVAGAHDLFAVRTQWLGERLDPLAPHALFFFVLLQGALVVERYSASVAEVRALNLDLSRRITEREAQLREAQAVADERQRIMRDIHDGLGSQLVGLLSLVRRPRMDPPVLEEHVKTAIDELRVTVDSMQPVDGDLGAVLASLRYRLEPRLQAAGLAIDWDVGPLPPLPRLTPQVVLHLQRMLLEAFTNAIRHATATRLVVSAAFVDAAGAPHVRVSLADNGVGPAGVERAAGGHGIANMRARAEAIGASVRIEPAEGGGTRVAITWPTGLALAETRTPGN